MRTDSKKQFDWIGRLEQLEDRHMMSADPLGGLLGGALEHHAIADEVPALDQHVESTPDFWIENRDQTELDNQFRQIEKSLQEAHGQTGLNNVRADYGFTGIGQTVAVIDSGIAYDHFALGGGFGQNYRVVGGWDFTGENDADPYDDGPSGSHGTHVAGIVGGDSGNDTGVAPGVDLVGLRVFDDAGAGYFSWVENALNWVHDNRNNFENPITAINLSLGVSGWNAESIPSWAMLEDEFAQLEADGIFIAVSAGNAYTSYNATGLSYPAASSYVIPVMSTDDSGLLSYFSQRSSRAIAAPGRWITSTVPDYAGNNNGTTDDYATMSGTSMAAPYVAGASVLVREAMEFVGYTNITQDTIYNHMIATSDSFFDSETNQSYNRLNLEAAIDALMPADDYGSTLAAAYNLGSVSDPMSMSGAIATLGDIDYFSFTAASTGTVTFEATNTTHNLTASWIVNSSQSLGSLSTGGNSVVVDVVAGQDYTVGFSSGDGLGFYDFDVTAEAAFTFTDWGAVSFTQMQGISAANDTWYRVEAASNGYLTVDTSFDGTGGQISLELYDTSLAQIDAGNPVNNTSRVDTYATAGNEFYVRVLGSNTDVDFRLTNLVSLSSTTVNVAGTSADDTFAFTAGTNHTVSVNGVDYSFASIAITDINFDGGAGYDSITMTGSAGDDTATLRVGNAKLSGNGYTNTALNIEDTSVIGGGGNDVGYFYDSAGDDTFVGQTGSSQLSGVGFSHIANDFDRVYAYSSTGADIAHLHDSSANDSFIGRSNFSQLESASHYLFAGGFTQVEAHATTGSDIAYFYGSDGDDNFTGGVDQSQLSGTGFENIATGFDRVFAYANLGNDSASFYDSTGNDNFVGQADYSQMSGVNFNNYASGFDEVFAYTSTGTDSAYLYDSTNDETFIGATDYSQLSNTIYSIRVNDFDKVYAYATVGNDIANLYDSVGNDILLSHSNFSQFSGTGFSNFAGGFDQVNSYASSGNDLAFLYDSIGDDDFVGRSDSSQFTGAGFQNVADGFDQVYAYASNGNDTATFYGTTGDDSFVGRSNFSQMSGVGFSIFAGGFDQVLAYGSGGNDIASLYGANGNDTLIGRSDFSQLSGVGFSNYAEGFSRVYAYGVSGNDTATLYDSLGNDNFYGKWNYSQLSGIGFFNYASGFDQVTAFASSGYDSAYLYDSSGDDNFVGRTTFSQLSGVGFSNLANGFDQVNAYATTGTDIAYIYDSIGDDTFVGRSSYSKLSGTGFSNFAAGFDQVSAYATSGYDTASLYGTSGDDIYVGYSDSSQLSGSDYFNYTSGFERVYAFDSSGYDEAYFYEIGSSDSILGTGSNFYRSNASTSITLLGEDRVAAYAEPGEWPIANVSAIDYLFEKYGDWSV